MVSFVSVSYSIMEGKMRKILYVFGLLSLFLIGFFFISNQKKEFISFRDVSPIEYDDRGQNQNVKDSFVRITVNGKWGVAKKKNGELLLKPEYDYIDNFYEGYAIVQKNEKYGVIDEKFNMVIRPEWEYISPFHLGYAMVRAKNQKSGVIDVNGKIIIKPLYYDYISQFDNDFLAIAKNNKDNKKVLIDLKGNVVKTLK